MFLHWHFLFAVRKSDAVWYFQRDFVWVFSNAEMSTTDEHWEIIQEMAAEPATEINLS